MLIAVDPGVRKAGVAMFDDGELAAAWLVRGDGPCETAFRVRVEIGNRIVRDVVNLLVIEKPQVYLEVKIDNNDLIDLSVMVGAVAGNFSSVRFVLPREWKGQVPKDVMINRIKERLSSEERDRVELPNEKKAQADVWDAIGIGLYRIGRLRKRRK
jgi:hypothetical protein